jgi:hypothetical protein
MSMQLSYPLGKKGTITSGFGPRWGRNHNGIDIGVTVGTSVKSIYDGEVVRSDMRDVNGYGNFIIVKHNINGETLYSCYAHLSKRIADVGDKVKKGDEIGKSGGAKGAVGSGMSTGPHLHFEIRKSQTGNFINPKSYLDGKIPEKTNEKPKEDKPKEDKPKEKEDKDSNETEDVDNEDDKKPKIDLSKALKTLIPLLPALKKSWEDTVSDSKKEKNTNEEIDNLYKSISSFSFNKNFLNEGVKITDISNTSTYKNASLKNNKYFILHHTAGKGKASDVVNILNSRGLGIQYIIDREGKIYKATKGTKGAHVAYFYDTAPKDMNNSTAQGVEIIADNDSDILINQCKSALLLVKSLGYSLSQIYGHGEVSYNKLKTEGATCKAYIKKYWSTPESKLPGKDSSLDIDVKEPKPKKSEEKKKETEKPKKSEEKKKETEKPKIDLSKAAEVLLPMLPALKKNWDDTVSDSKKEKKINEEILKINNIIKKIL